MTIIVKVLIEPHRADYEAVVVFEGKGENRFEKTSEFKPTPGFLNSFTLHDGARFRIEERKPETGE